jgi:DNA gyrase subunit B
MSPPDVVVDPVGRGSEFYLIPDAEVFGDAKLNWPDLRGRLFELAHLLPGLRVECDDEMFHAPMGLMGLAGIIFAMAPEQPVTHVRTRIGHIELDVVFHLASDAAEACVSYCNGSRTRAHGSHVAGVRDALSTAGWAPSGILLHTVHYDPKYAGPTKERLSEPGIRTLLAEGLPDVLKAHPDHGRRRALNRRPPS